MRKRKDEHADSNIRGVHEDGVEAFVRAAARSIRQRLDEDHPAVDNLADDDEFARTSRQLVGPAVPQETVERLSRATDAIVAAIADRALARRPAVSDEWLAWAFRRLKRAYAGELFFLLEAIERHVDPPLILRVLAHADSDWAWGWCLGVITGFVERRVRAGEEPVAPDFDAIDRTNEENVAAVIAELEGILPPTTIRVFEDWRRRRAELDFFRGVGRIWEPREDEPALTSVGGRASVVATLESALLDPGTRSVLLVGEHGVGKSAVLREVLRALHRNG